MLDLTFPSSFWCLIIYRFCHSKSTEGHSAICSCSRLQSEESYKIQNPRKSQIQENHLSNIDHDSLPQEAALNESNASSSFDWSECMLHPCDSPSYADAKFKQCTDDPLSLKEELLPIKYRVVRSVLQTCKDDGLSSSQGKWSVHCRVYKFIFCQFLFWSRNKDTMY